MRRWRQPNLLLRPLRRSDCGSPPSRPAAAGATVQSSRLASQFDGLALDIPALHIGFRGFSGRPRFVRADDRKIRDAFGFLANQRPHRSAGRAVCFDDSVRVRAVIHGPVPLRSRTMPLPQRQRPPKTPASLPAGRGLADTSLRAGSAATTLATRELGMRIRHGARSEALKIAVVCGTNAGSTSTTPVPILNNIGSGVSGC
jgi:hypothetical protein